MNTFVVNRPLVLPNGIGVIFRNDKGRLVSSESEKIHDYHLVPISPETVSVDSFQNVYVAYPQGQNRKLLSVHYFEPHECLRGTQWDRRDAKTHIDARTRGATFYDEEIAREFADWFMADYNAGIDAIAMAAQEVEA